MGVETSRTSSYVRSEGYYDSAGTMYQYASAVNNLISGLTASANYTYVNNVFSGLTASANASQINNLFSGLASTVTAGMITANPLAAASAAYAASAGTAVAAATAAQATTAVAAATALAAASATYAASAGTAAQATTAVAAATALAALSAVTAGQATTAVAAATAAAAAYAASAGTLSGVTATVAKINTIIYAATSHKLIIGKTTCSTGSAIVALGVASATCPIFTPEASGCAYGVVSGTSLYVYLDTTLGTSTTGVVNYIVFNDT